MYGKRTLEILPAMARAGRAFKSMKRFPRVVASQRLQALLLLTALGAVVLGCLLVTDLVRNFRSAVVSDASKSLANALKELREAEERWSKQQARAGSNAPREALDTALRLVSYEVLRSYPDIEGGYYLEDEPIGHSFPTYTEPGSGLKQPDIERNAVLACLAASRASGNMALDAFDDGRDLVVVSASAAAGRRFAVWGLKRYIDFNSFSHTPGTHHRDHAGAGTKSYLDFNAYGRLLHQLALGGLMLVSLASIGTVLKLSFGMQRSIAGIQAGLARLRTDLNYRIPDQRDELSSMATAINEMAASRQKLEGDLRREDRLRVMGRVVAGIAHEIRNPLNSIRLTLEVLKRRLARHHIGQEEVALLAAETERLEKLLNSILVFGAGEPSRIFVQPILPVLERTMALVKPQIEDRGIAAQVTAPPGLEAAVNGDHLQQAMMNLLLNAIDAAGTGGRIQVSLQHVNGHVEVDVLDSGPGLSSEQQERLFEVFYTTKDSGTGMGLAVTRTLLEKMGATIQYVGSDPGAHFRILLPAGAAHHG